MTGNVFKYGNNIDTDVIIPARYLNTSDPTELGKHCMEDIDENFINNVQQGDIIVALENFGCGSSREHAPISIKAAGVSCVIAVSFARIFYRNSINCGLPIVECEAAAVDAQSGDVITVDVDAGHIENKTQNKRYDIKPFPAFIKNIINEGGLMKAAKKGII